MIYPAPAQYNQITCFLHNYQYMYYLRSICLYWTSIFICVFLICYKQALFYLLHRHIILSNTMTENQPLAVNKDSAHSKTTNQFNCNSGNNHALTLIYHPKINSQSNYLFKVDKQFLEQLKQCQELSIEGNAEHQVIINTVSHLYKVKGINISTTLLVLNQAGTIFQQTSTYLDLQQFSPHFHEIYSKIYSISYANIPNSRNKQTGQQIHSFQQLVQSYSFTEQSVRAQCFIGETDFQRLSKAMKLVKIGQSHSMEGAARYLFVTLPFSVWIMREIVKAYNQLHINLLQTLSAQTLLSYIPAINPQILTHISKVYGFQETQNIQAGVQNSKIKMTAKTIMKFIISQMAVAKKQYTSYTFSQVLDQMLMVYMPAQIQVTSSMLSDNKDKGKDKQKDKFIQQLYACRFQHFIDVKGQKFVFYDYMELQTQVTSRLKFLSGFKNRWKISQLKAIFRGLDFTENGKFLPLSEFLLKKFRKYGDQYEIKFVLPNK